MLAVKMHEDVVLTQDQGNYECSMAYNNEMIEMVEQDIVKKLDFRLNYATSLDFVLQILYLEDSGQGKVHIDKVTQIQNLITQALPIIFLCQNEY